MVVCAAASLVLPPTRLNPITATTTMVAATIAPVQLARRRSGRSCSASNTGSGRFATGAPPWASSYWATSGSPSARTARARARMWPRA